MTATDPRIDQQAAEAVAGGVRPRRFGAWYVVEHEVRVMRNYRATAIATAIGTPIIYLFAFGVGMGVLVTANLGPGGIDGVDYLTFVAPALICTTAVTMAAMEFTYPVMLGFKWNPRFVGMNAAPLSPTQIITGIVIFVSFRIGLPCAAYYVVMLVFGAVPSPWGVLVVPIALLTGLAFGTPILAYTVTVNEDRGQFAVIGRVLVLPVTLFSGTVFPLDQLPWFLQWLGWISPLWHGTELARLASYGSEQPLWLTFVHVAYLVALAIIGWRLACRFAIQRLGR